MFGVGRAEVKELVSFILLFLELCLRKMTLIVLVLPGAWG